MPKHPQGLVGAHAFSNFLQQPESLSGPNL